MLIHSFCSEFDKYKVSISVRQQASVTRVRGEPTMWEFKENLEPGRSCQVAVKTVRQSDQLAGHRKCDTQ
jgi:hypothetical protein